MAERVNVSVNIIVRTSRTSVSRVTFLSASRKGNGFFVLVSEGTDFLISRVSTTVTLTGVVFIPTDFGAGSGFCIVVI